MTRSRIPLVLIACCVLFAGRSAAANAAQQAAAPVSDPQTELKALINSPEARSVAGFRCSSVHSACPLSASDAEALSDHFDATLLTGTGTVTPLIKGLEALLASSYKNDAVWPADVAYAIVHLVKFSVDGKSHRGRWLLFGRDKGKITASSGTRIMGSKRVAIVFVHLGVEVDLESFDERTRQNVPVPREQAASNQYANVEYRAIAKPKLPINIQRLLGLLQIATKVRALTVRETQKVAMLGFGLYTDIPVPSDLTVFGARVGDEPVGFGNPITYDNEGKYFWDASVAVPINKITLLEYDDQDGTFTPRIINRQSIYGTINVYPFPVDIKDGNLRWFLPRAMVGIGMTGRPGENFLLAGAFGIKEFQVFVGSAFANHRVLKPGTDPANGANYTQRYASRLTYGINVPVVSALKKLAGSS